MADWFLRGNFFGWNRPSASGEENLSMYFSPFHNYLPLEKGGALLWKKKHAFPSPNDTLCQVWLKMAIGFYRRRFFNFCYFVIISPWKKGGPSIIWINFTQGCFMLSMVEIGQKVMERKIFKFVNIFSWICNYLPLEKGWALHLNKVDFPSAKDDFRQVWLKLTQWFWRGFSKFVNVFLQFFLLHPLGKGWGPLFKQI
mgnify:CR=1 FL=1